MAAKIFLKLGSPGNDSNNGETSGAPVKTFHEALEKVSAGGTIEVLDAGPHSPSKTNALRAVINKNVNIVAADGVTPIIDGTEAQTPDDAAGALPAFNQAAVACVATFTGFTFQNFDTSIRDGANIIVKQNGVITVQYNQCTFKDIDGTGIFNTPPAASSASPNKMDRCEVQRTATARIFTSPPGGDMHFVVQNSVFHYTGTDSGAVYLGVDNNNHVNGTVRNCSFLVEVNNTTGTSNGVIRCGTIENVIIRNAATVGSFTTLAALKAKTAYSNNCIFGNFAVGEVSTGASTTGLLNSDPLFVNEGAAPPDLKLQSGSPCIGTGKTIAAVTVDFDGASRSAPYDIGAFKFTSGGGGGVNFTSNDDEEIYSIKFSSSFTIHGTANKLVTRKFNSDKDNRQAPYFITTPGPSTIRERDTPYKNET